MKSLLFAMVVLAFAGCASSPRGGDSISSARPATYPAGPSGTQIANPINTCDPNHGNCLRNKFGGRYYHRQLAE